MRKAAYENGRYISGRYKGMTLKERLMCGVVAKDNGCWDWRYRTDKDGYGRVRLNRKTNPKQAHRIFYEAFVGPIPDGLTIDHLCLNKKCCNPAHLEPVSSIENHRRYLMRVSRYDHLKLHACGLPNHRQGENLRISPDGHKQCRACNKIAVSAYQQRRKERMAS